MRDPEGGEQFVKPESTKICNEEESMIRNLTKNLTEAQNVRRTVLTSATTQPTS